jgi:hypothetical protein
LGIMNECHLVGSWRKWVRRWYDDVGPPGGVAGELECAFDRFSATGVYREN